MSPQPPPRREAAIAIGPTIFDAREAFAFKVDEDEAVEGFDRGASGMKAGEPCAEAIIMRPSPASSRCACLGLGCGLRFGCGLGFQLTATLTLTLTLTKPSP